MVIWTPPERPMILALRTLDGKIVDAREPHSHQAVIVELPILVAIRAKAISGVIVPLVSESHGDAISGESPKLLDQAVIQFFRPFARKKGDNLLPSANELRSVPPAGIRGVSQRDFFRITRIPSVFRQTNFLNRRFASEWRQRRTGRITRWRR